MWHCLFVVIVHMFIIYKNKRNYKEFSLLRPEDSVATITTPTGNMAKVFAKMARFGDFAIA